MRSVRRRRHARQARAVVQAFLDLYAYERGWVVMKAAQGDFDQFIHVIHSIENFWLTAVTLPPAKE